MAESRVLVLPAQELAVLQSAAEQSPYFAHLLKQLPGLKVALAHSLPDSLTEVAVGARDAASQVQANTHYPEDWDDLKTQAAELAHGRHALRQAQEAALAARTPLDADPKACPCCGSTRRIWAYSKGTNWGGIPHLGFEYDGYMPSDLGIPAAGGDGPQLEVCLVCGHILNGEFPLDDETLKARVARRMA